MVVRFSDEQVMSATGARRVRAGSRGSYEAVSTDTRTLSPGCLFVALVGDRFDAHDYLAQAAARGAAGAVVARGRPRPALPDAMTLFEVDDTLGALGALARFHRRRFTLPLGAVTGSNGKTTTKEMAAAIAQTRGPVLKTQGNLNNEVGLPLTLFGLEEGHVAGIVEMGMNHPGEIARLTEIAQPSAGVITSVQAAHLEGLGSLDGVAKAKGELFEGLGPEATAVVNVDNARIAEQARRTRAKVLTFGRDDRAEVRLESAEPQGREGFKLVIRTGGAAHEVALRFLGEHNALNATAAFALCLALGYSPEACAQGLAAARPHSRRLELLPAPAGYCVLDDCYNANPSSMSAALETVVRLAQAEGGRAIAVLGDMLELGSDEDTAHRALAREVDELVSNGRLSAVAFLGPRAARTRASEASERVAYFEDVGDAGALVEWLSPRLARTDIVLVKGSRGMRLERVVAALTGASAPEGH